VAEKWQKPRRPDPRPPWSSESVETSQGGAENTSEVLEQTLIPEPPWHDELKETSEGGAETSPKGAEARAEDSSTRGNGRENPREGRMEGRRRAAADAVPSDILNIIIINLAAKCSL
jgi:hypothetical protein